MTLLDIESKQLINTCRTLGSRDLPIYLENIELTKLCWIVANDLKQQILVNDIVDIKDLKKNYYEFELEWFQKKLKKDIDFEQLFIKLKKSIPDFPTYFKNLCELHKHRKKFKMILEYQSFPNVDQYIPRCLLEFGLFPSDELATWLMWRKWIYDIDNRSAQQTGYLFEPILASCIGGIPYSSKKSPIRRHSDSNKGRQVDCIDGKTAYEFKMRVTIAASGQGRFQEELDFAKDCNKSGYTPKLMVLDPTPSDRLTELKKEYEKFGGSALIGEDAWKHLTKKSGKTMGIFIKKYVEEPIKKVEKNPQEFNSLKLTRQKNSLVITIGQKKFKISRK